MTLEAGSSAVARIRKRLDQRILSYKMARRQYKQEKAERERLKKLIEDAEQALSVAQGIAQHVQQQAHQQIAQVVSRCLEAVFEAPYEFQIRFERKRNRTEAVLFFQRDGKEVDPLTASGGGVVDVAAFALRLSCLLMSRPALARVMVLDEPFRFVSQHYRANVRALMEALADEMQVQFIIVTHDPELASGTVVRL